MKLRPQWEARAGVGYVKGEGKAGRGPTHNKKTRKGWAYDMTSYPRYTSTLSDPGPKFYKDWWGIDCEVWSVDFERGRLYVSEEVDDAVVVKDGRKCELRRAYRPFCRLWGGRPPPDAGEGRRVREEETAHGGTCEVYEFQTWDGAKRWEEKVREAGGRVELGEREDGVFGGKGGPRKEETEREGVDGLEKTKPEGDSDDAKLGAKEEKELDDFFGSLI